jgi:hypothetical protein
MAPAAGSSGPGAWTYLQVVFPTGRRPRNDDLMKHGGDPGQPVRLRRRGAAA